MRSFITKLKNRLKSGQKTIGARALVINGDQVLLVKHTYTSGWYTIGGGVEKGESPLEAIKRELMEETGITLNEPPSLLGIYHNTRENRDDYVTVYVCKSFKKSPTSSLEIAEEKWFHIDALPEDISPATRRRIEEYQGKRPINDKW